ncbi:caldesmon isoform X7 [Pogoniulus pusillus]|uniref:caldesmon isoform X7 n=1 Tax=Pogoniulus pusillus TaxID=488313 RepID=UPI0030B96DCE
MDDFERRRELRRKKREGMRLEVESLSYQRNDDDEEEAARERRRRARQERLRQMEEGDLSGEVTEKTEANTQNSVAEEESKHATSTRGADDEAALLERLARREERRQKRLQEALERQKELDPTITDGSLSLPSRKAVTSVEENESTGKEEKAETRRGRCEIEDTEPVTKAYQRNNWRQDEEEEGKKEGKDKEEVQEEKPKEVLVEENQVDATAEKPSDKEEVVETKSQALNADEHQAENGTNAVTEGEQSVTDALDKEKLKDEERAEVERKQAEEKEKLEAEERERLKAEEEKKAAEEKQKAEEEKRAAEEREKAKAEEERKAAEEREKAKAEEERKAAEERARAKAEEEKRAAEEKAKLEAEKLQAKQKMEEKKLEDKQVKEKKAQAEKPPAAFLTKQGEESKVEAKKEKLPDEKLQPTSKKDQVKDDKDKGKAPKEEMKSIWDRKKGVPEQKAQNGERELAAPKLKPTENAFGRSNLKGTANAEEAKLREKQQEAAAELDELKKRREERRKILEEEEQKKKQEEAERKAREEEEKRRMKEEIERRRAEAAEKRQKMPEDGVSEDKKPFKCFSPKGSSLKIEERAEFLNKSAQKSGMKPTHTTAVVSKIDSRLEQYTSAIEQGTKTAKPARPAASDLHVPAEGVRNIKSMWEKGNVFSSPSGAGAPNKETAGLKVGVSSRINEWLTKTPESNKSPAPKPSDLKPGDVSGKRNLWEKQSVEKPASSSKVSAMGKKSETNAGLRQLEKEP